MPEPSVPSTPAATGPGPASAVLAPAGRSPRAVATFLAAVVVLLALDLFSKAQAFEHVAGTPVLLARDAAENGPGVIEPHDGMIVVPKVLGLRLTVNRGAVFGLGQGGRWVFVLFSLIAATVIVLVFRRSRSSDLLLHLALAAVLAGALGNLYDRLRFGVVRDFMRLFPDVRLPFGWSWPGGDSGLYPWIFNIADVCLVVGLIVLMILLYRHDRRERLEQAAEANAEQRPRRAAKEHVR